MPTFENKDTSLLNNDSETAISRTSEILNRLRTDMILGKYAAGSRLIESKLAENFDTSRGPIRYCLQVLEQEGLVTTLPFGGKEVIGFSIEQVSDLFDFRCLIEKKALELILKKKSFPFQSLLEVLEAFDLHESTPDAVNQIVTTAHLDVQFHRSFFLMANNKPMLVAWNSNANLFQTILEIAHQTYATSQAFYDAHRQIAGLIMQKNINCIDMVEEHIMGGKITIVQRMKEAMNN